MRPSSLRRELTRASMLTTFVVLLLCAAALLAYELDTFRSSWVADLRTQADLIAKTSEAALVFNDKKSAEENLLLLKLQPRLVAAVIFAQDGSVFARYVEPGVAVPASIGRALGESGYRFSGSMLEVVYQSSTTASGWAPCTCRPSTMSGPGSGRMR